MSETKIPIDVLRDIIIDSLELCEDRVMIWNNRSVLPKDENLFIALELSSNKILANNNAFENREGDGFYEVFTTTAQEIYNIDILSRGLEALRRKEEVIMALKSTFAQKKQEEYGMMISKIANLIDLSAVENTSRLYRFQCRVTIHASYTKEKVIEYYETFNGEAHTEDGEQVDFQIT